MGYCQCVVGVFQIVVCFVLNWRFGCFLFYVRFKIVVLNYEVVDNMVENGVVVEIFVVVVQEVFNCFWCFVVKCFDYDIVMIGVESNYFCILF